MPSLDVPRYPVVDRSPGFGRTGALSSTQRGTGRTRAAWKRRPRLPLFSVGALVQVSETALRSLSPVTHALLLQW